MMGRWMTRGACVPWLRNMVAAACLVALATPQMACTTDESGEGGPPVAGFSESATQGAPGTAIQFTDTSGGGVTAWSWDFGAAGVSTEQNPLVTFAGAGVYTVRLRVTGPQGTSSVEKAGLVTIGDAPTAAFSCTPEDGLAYLDSGGFEVVCTDGSTNDTTEWLWDFGDGTTYTTQDVTHRYEAAGTYTIRLTASTAAGSTISEQSMEIREIKIVITPDPEEVGTDTSVPFTATLNAVDDSGAMRIFSWQVDGQVVGSVASVEYTFTDIGEQQIRITGLTGTGPTDKAGGSTSSFDTTFGPPVADLGAVPDTDEVNGSGPLLANFEDRSSGVIYQWVWSFGDGQRCVHVDGAPDDHDAPDLPVCGSPNPTYLYTETGIYDVSLDVTGWVDAEQTEWTTEDTTRNGFVRVYIGDPSFETQTLGDPIGAPWQSLRPAAPTVSAEHLARPSDSIGAEFGMPSDGSQWAQIEGLGTDGSADVRSVENGLRQSFLVPPVQTVLQFDYAFLYAEPPASPKLDAVIATVSNGVTEVDVAGSLADPDSPYEGESASQPARDGGMVRGTPSRTASLNIADAFPGHDLDTPLTLTIRTTNDFDDLASPIVYVDNVRFVSPGSDIVPTFELGDGPFRAGEPIQLTNTTCIEVDTVCLSESSWRWDFGSHGTTPRPEATGSSEFSPTVTYGARGVYTVELEATRSDSAATTSADIEVLDPVVAGFSIVQGDGPFTAPVTLDFIDTSTVDADETITDYSWSFGGLATSNLANPSGIEFTAPDTYTIFLTITTSEGVTDRISQEIVVE